MFNPNLAHSRQFIIVISRQLAKMIVAMAIASLIIYFLAGQISVIVSSLEEKKRLGSLLENRKTNIELLSKDLAGIANREKAINNAIVDTDNILEYVGGIESIAAQSSLKQAFQFGAPQALTRDMTGMGISRIDHAITLNGSIATLAKYVALHERLPYLAGISSIAITSSSDSVGWEGDSRSLIQASIYVK